MSYPPEPRWAHLPRREEPAAPAVTTYEEWRVTGDPGEGFPPYAFTFSPIRGDQDPEKAARGFVALVHDVSDWTDGPHLHRRTVTVTDWEPA